MISVQLARKTVVVVGAVGSVGRGGWLPGKPSTHLLKGDQSAVNNDGAPHGEDVEQLPYKLWLAGMRATPLTLSASCPPVGESTYQGSGVGMGFRFSSGLPGCARYR